MPITVEIPEHNTSVEFPDGTPPEVMQKAIESNFPSKISQSQPVTPSIPEEVTSKFKEIPTIQGGTSYEVPKPFNLLGEIGKMATLGSAEGVIPFGKAPTVKEVASAIMPETAAQVGGLIGGVLGGPLGAGVFAGGGSIASDVGKSLAGKEVGGFTGVMSRAAGEGAIQGVLDMFSIPVGKVVSKAAGKIATEATGGLFKDIAGKTIKTSEKVISQKVFDTVNKDSSNALKTINLNVGSFDGLSPKEASNLVKQKMNEHGIPLDSPARTIFDRIAGLSWIERNYEKEQLNKVTKAMTDLTGKRLSDKEKISLVSTIQNILGKAVETEKGFISSIAKGQKNLEESQLKNVDKENLDTALKYFFGENAPTYKTLSNPVQFANELINLKRQRIYENELIPPIKKFTKKLASEGKNIYPELTETSKMFRKYDIERKFKVGTGGPIEELLNYIKTDKKDSGVSKHVMDLVSGDPNLEQWMIEKYGKNITQYDPSEIVRIVTALNDKISDVPGINNYAKGEIRAALKSDLGNFFTSNSREDLANLYKTKLTEYGKISDKLDAIKNLSEKTPNTLFETLTPDGMTDIKNALTETTKDKSDNISKLLKQGHAAYITGIDEVGGISIEEMKKRAAKLGKAGLEDLWGTKGAKDTVDFINDLASRSSIKKDAVTASMPKLPTHNVFFEQLANTKEGLKYIVPELLKNPKQISEVQSLIGRDASKKMVDAFNDHLFPLTASGAFPIKEAVKTLEAIETDHVKHEALKQVFKGREEQLAAIKDLIYTVSKGAKGAQETSSHFGANVTTGLTGGVVFITSPLAVAPIAIGLAGLQQILHNPGLTKKLGQALTGTADKKILDELAKITVKSMENNFINNLKSTTSITTNQENKTEPGMLEKALNYGNSKR